MAKIIIKIDGENIQQTVDGIKGKSCTLAGKAIADMIAKSGGTLLSDVKTSEYYEEELLAENVNRG